MEKYKIVLKDNIKKMLHMVAQAVLEKAKVGGSQVQGQPGLQRKTVSKKKKKKEYYARMLAKSSKGKM
jgi:hypothetical protein